MQCLAQISHIPCTAFKKYVTIQQHADTDTPKSATVLFKINATHCCYTQILYNQVIWPELYYHYVVAPSSLNHTHCHPPPHHPHSPHILKQVQLLCFQRGPIHMKSGFASVTSPIGLVGAIVRTGRGNSSGSRQTIEEKIDFDI